MDFQGIVAQVKEAVSGSIGKLLLPLIEQKVKEEIEKNSDHLVDLAIAKIEELIPGDYEKAFLEPLKPSMKAQFKEFLLSQADKIS